MISEAREFFHDPNVLSTLCGVAAFSVVMLIWTALLDDTAPASDRLKAVSQRREDFESGMSDRRQKNSRRAKLQKASAIKEIVDRLKLAQGKSLDELRLKLRRAGYQSRDTMFVFLFTKLAMLCGLGAAAGFCFLLLGIGGFEPILNLLLTLLGTAAGWMLPDVIIKNMSQKREELLRKGMPDALDLMVICAEAGLGLDASFERVGREIAPTTPELAEEVSLTAVELNFLPDRHQALKGLAERVPVQSVTSLVNTLIQSEKYGTPLAQALRVLAGEMREERMMKAEEKAAALPAILTVPMILFILPPLFCVLIGPAAIRVLMALSGENAAH